MAVHTYTVKEIANVPWLIREINITATDTGADAIPHGGPAIVPDIVIPVLTSTNPTASELSIQAKSTTTVTVDSEGSTKTAKVYCIWLGQAAGGIGS